MSKAEPTNIEEQFVAAMRLIGGKRPSELNPSADQAENADVVLPDDNLIIEIKTLVEESVSQDSFKPKLIALYKKWIVAGKIPKPKGNIIISTRDLPRDCAFEFLKAINSPVINGIKKASRQIKQTKKSLDMTSAKGLLVLCNSGNSFLQPDVIMHGIARSLRTDFSSINWVIFSLTRILLSTAHLEILLK